MEVKAKEHTNARARRSFALGNPELTIRCKLAVNPGMKGQTIPIGAEPATPHR